MSLSSTSCRNDYTGNGAANSYSYNYKIFLKTDLVVTVANTATPPVETTLVADVDYSVAGIGASAGGSITLINSGQAWLTAGNLTTGYHLTIRRVRAISQLTDIRNQGAFFPEIHEDTFDQIVMICQQLQEEISRSVKTATTSLTDNLVMPEPLAGEYVGWNTGGTALENKVPPTNGANGANGATWYLGAGAPAGALGVVNDLYLNNSNGDYYQKTAVATWTLQGNLTGPAGAGPWTTVNAAASPYTASGAATRLRVDTSGGPVTINLPAAAGVVGTDWTIMKITGDANLVTIVPNGTDTIQDDPSQTLSTKYESLKLSALIAGEFAIL